MLVTSFLQLSLYSNDTFLLQRLKVKHLTLFLFVFMMFNSCDSNHSSTQTDATEAAAVLEAGVMGTMTDVEMSPVAETEEEMPSVSEPSATKVIPIEVINSAIMRFDEGHYQVADYWGQEGAYLFNNQFEHVNLQHDGGEFVILDCLRESDKGRSYHLSFSLPRESDQQPEYLRVIASNATYMEGSFVSDEGDTEYFYFHNGKLVGYVLQDDTEQANEINLFETLTSDSLSRVEHAIRKEIQPILFPSTVPAKFAGSWKISGDTEGFNFSTDLFQFGEIVFGSYCGYTQTLHDCGVPEQGGSLCFVQGKVEEEILKLDYFPCYTKGIGRANLSIEDNYLVWETQSRPDGFSAVPEKSVLVKNEE